LNELKRRNVLRVGAAYVVGAWLLIQVAETLIPLFGFGDTPTRIVVIMLAIAFVPVLIFAWAFEFTPEGLKKEVEIDRSQPISLHTGKKLDRMIMVVLALALGYFAFDKFVLDPQREAAMQQQTAAQLASATENARKDGRIEALVESYGEKSIAVLPFQDMSQDKDQEYLSDGIAEELLNLLARVPELRVISRSSAFSYKGKDIKLAQVAKELNVAHILEGSVRKAGNRVRITVQLVEARSDTNLWSQTYDRTLDDIFQIQDEIGAAVVDGLKITLMGSILTEKNTDPKVYALYLQGRYLLNQKGEENLKKATSYFNQALEIDPEYAPAWVDISRSYHYQIRSRMLSREKGYALALEAVERALAINSESAPAWANLAYLKKTYDWDWKGASSAIDKAMELDPRNAQVIGVAASLALNLGQTTVSLELHEQSVVMDPLDLIGLSSLGQDYVLNGRLDEGIEIFNRIVDLNPDYTAAYPHLGRAYLRKGDIDRALIEFNKHPDWTLNIFDNVRVQFALGNEQAGRALVDEYLATSPHDHPLATAVVYVLRGDNDTAFEWLDIAYQQRDRWLAYILTNSYMINLTSDPRYPVFLEKLGFLEAWKAMPPESSISADVSFDLLKESAQPKAE
jgi:TolB-like protein/Flp pilus assembly protein TadD